MNRYVAAYLLLLRILLNGSLLDVLNLRIALLIINESWYKSHRAKQEVSLCYFYTCYEYTRGY